VALVGIGILPGTSAGQAPADGHAHAPEPACPIAWWARPSDTGRYIGYYVGGGNPFYRHGEDRHIWEGTWGWDYSGFCFPSRIVLDWYHGWRYQGGAGAYRTDGPNLLRQVIEK
jgi:hypothetical protein